MGMTGVGRMVAVVMLWSATGMWAAQSAGSGATGDASLNTPPAGATGQCNDGTFATAKQKWQACGGHKGVKSWFADNAGKTGTTAPASNAAMTGAAAGGGGRQKAAADGGGQPVAPGGGPGMVWVNQDTKVYHCQGSKFYGTTKNGKYMSEADAKKAGDRPNAGKACGK